MRRTFPRQNTLQGDFLAIAAGHGETGSPRLPCYGEWSDPAALSRTALAEIMDREVGMNTAISIILVAIGIILFGYGVRRLLMWMGEKGWIYYGNHPGASSAGALAALEITSMLKPENEHVIEEIRSEAIRGETADAGELLEPLE